MNTYIGEPMVVIKQYGIRTKFRSLESITKEECRIILDLATDNGNFKGIAVNHISIDSVVMNFAEGNISFGGGDTYYFTIRYDGTVEIIKMEFHEKENKFHPSGKRLKIYRFSDIIFYMMKCGFDLVTH